MSEVHDEDAERGAIRSHFEEAEERSLTMKADHARSEGARYERAAVRARLRRQINSATLLIVKVALQEELNWILERQERYDKAPGGLGKTIRKR